MCGLLEIQLLSLKDPCHQKISFSRSERLGYWSLLPSSFLPEENWLFSKTSTEMYNSFPVLYFDSGSFLLTPLGVLARRISSRTTRALRICCQTLTIYSIMEYFGTKYENKILQINIHSDRGSTGHQEFIQTIIVKFFGDMILTYYYYLQ